MLCDSSLQHLCSQTLQLTRKSQFSPLLPAASMLRGEDAQGRRQRKGWCVGRQREMGGRPGKCDISFHLIVFSNIALGKESSTDHTTAPSRKTRHPNSTPGCLNSTRSKIPPLQKGGLQLSNLSSCGAPERSRKFYKSCELQQSRSDTHPDASIP